MRHHLSPDLPAQIIMLLEVVGCRKNYAAGRDGLGPTKNYYWWRWRWGGGVIKNNAFGGNWISYKLI